ncbi:MAG TPA: c-type cytochrome [Rhizomicrobium sp.]|nr:c-type cytochrome [Rhizomicrobium sp.]
MNRLAILFLAAACVCSGAALADDAAIPGKIAKSCQSCHGAGGDSTSPSVPRLNGQPAGYLAQRLKSLRDPTKQSINAIHAMWDLSTHIGDDDISQIAKYYAAQKPTPAAGKAGALANEGARLYAGGGKGVPACQACHGLHGEGMGLAPRLAGQHGLYLDYQLTAFVVTMRNQGAMNHTAMDLSQHQIDALVAYLAKD